MRAIFVTVLCCLVGATATADVPPTRPAPRARHGAATRARRPGAPLNRRVVAGPPVALQLTDLVISIPVSRASIVHALTRDAWPALVRCVTPPPAVHGHVVVRVHPTDGGFEVEQVGPPVRRDRALGACFRDALSGLQIPPYEGDRPDVSVAFDLAVGMPAVGVRR
jgi:hypothetical protein